MTVATPPELSDLAVVQTLAGEVKGKIIGTEQRDASRHGGGQPQPFVCMAPAGKPSFWIAADLVTVQQDPTKKTLTDLIERVGRAEVQSVLGRMA